MKEPKSVYVKARVTPDIDASYREICESLGIKTSAHMRSLLEDFLEKHKSASNEVFVEVEPMAHNLYEVTVRIPCLENGISFFDYAQLQAFQISPLVEYIASGKVNDVESLGLINQGMFEGVVTCADVVSPVEDIRKYLTREFTTMLPFLKW